MCSKPDSGGSNCPTPQNVIAVVRLPGGRSAQFTASTSGVSYLRLRISSSGALAWIDKRGLVATVLQPVGRNRLSGTPSVLDSAARGFLSISGRTVRWYDIVSGARVNHSVTLPVP